MIVLKSPFYFIFLPFNLDHSTDLVYSVILWTIGTIWSLKNCGNFLSGFTAEQKYTVELHLRLLK